MITKSIFCLTIACCFACTLGFGQNALIEFRDEPIHFEFNYTIEINGYSITSHENEYTIPVNRNGLDTIKYQFNQSPAGWAIMRLMENMTYVVSLNSCSFYMIKPKENAKQGAIKFNIISQDTTCFLVGIRGNELKRISSGVVDRFEYYPPSAMCPYSAKRIQLKSLDNTIDENLNYHFLHGEKIEVIFEKKNESLFIAIKPNVKDQ